MDAPGSGELIRGVIKVVEGELYGQTDGEVQFMFNPTEYTISKSNSWTTTAHKGRNVPKYEFKGGDPRQMQLELFFNSYLARVGEQEQDLRKYLNRLFNMMMIDPGAQLQGQHSRMSKPPKCHVEWGSNTAHLAFKCYIVSCTVKYSMFSQEGIPIRATANLTLKEAVDSEDRLPTNPTSLGEAGRRLHTIAEGDRLDLIAYEEYGDATQWRRIAEANHLNNPLDLEVGSVLAIPPR